MSLNYLSICSGIEAASVAWQPLGWHALAFSEIDAFPCAVLAHHYPETPNLGDMTHFKEWPDATPDLLIGGTPCQSFSVAGLRAGLADPRGNLMLTFLAIADCYRPRWLVWENVPGVLSSSGGRDFGALLGGLAKLGYGFAYRILDAQYFGVAQRRRRVFVVGHIGNWRRAAAVLFERNSLQGHPAPRREAGQGIANAPVDRPDRGGGNSEGQRLIPETVGALCDGAHMGGGLTGRTPTADAYLPPMAMCLNAGGMGRQDAESETLIPIIGGGFDVAHSLRGEGFDASEDGTGRGTSIVPIAFDTTQITSPENRSNPQPGAPCHTLQAAAHPPAIAFDCKASGQNGFGVGEIASTMRAMGHTGSHCNGGGHQAVATATAVRRLTPRECERLQGFPDDYTLIPYRNKPAADGPRYKALGNSMAVPVMRWIGERIAMVDGIGARRDAA